MSTSKLPETGVRGQLASQLKERLARGEWPVGTMFPSQRDLAREYSVALGTVGHAIRRLVDEGALDVVKGRGTVVARAVRSEVRPQDAAPVPATVGLLAVHPRPQIGDQDREAGWEAMVVRVLEREFSSHGGGTRFRNLTRPGRSDAKPVREAARALLSDGVQAIVLVEVNATPWVAREIPDLRAALNIPLVCVSWNELPLNIPQVSYDNREMGYRAASHLLACGYTQVIFATPYTNEWVEQRLRGVQEAAAAAGLDERAVRRIAPKPVQQMPLSEMADAEQDLAEHLVRSESPHFGSGKTAVIAVNDYQAYRILDAARTKDLLPGRDFGLLGFDDAPRSCELGLTSIRPPLERLGVEAARVVRCALSGEGVPLRVSLPCELLARASTCRG